MKKDNCRVNYKYLLILGICIFMAYVFYVYMPSSIDDADTYEGLFRYYDLGIQHYTWKMWLEPWRAVSGIIYHLGLFNNGMDISTLAHTIFYFCEILITMLILKDKKEPIYFLVIMFILLPNEYTTKTHQTSTFFSLLILYFLNKYIDKRKKKFLFGAVLVLTYGLFFLADVVILGIYVIIPLVGYWLVACLQNREKHKAIIYGVFALSLMILALRTAGIIGDILWNNDFVSNGILGGYGGSEYASWGTFPTIWQRGIPYAIATIFQQFGVCPSGGMIQINSFFWVIRIVLIGLIGISYIYYLKKVVKKGVRNVSFLNGFCVIAITIVLLVNIINGVLSAYGWLGSPITRYTNIVWFLAMILFCNWIEEVLQKSEYLCNIYKENRIVICSIVIVLTFANVGNIYMGRSHITKEICQDETDYLEKQEGIYHYGIGSFGKSTAIGALSNMDICCINGSADEVEGIKAERTGITDDKGNFFNFILVDEGSPRGLEKEVVEKIRPDYIDMNYVNSDNGIGILYLYDYDIRWTPQLVMQVVGEEYEINDPLTYNFDFSVGINRVEITTSTVKNINVSVGNNDEIKNVEIKNINNKIYVELECTKNLSAQVHLNKIDDDQPATIYKIETKIVKGTVELDKQSFYNNCGSIYFEPGNYIVTFVGKDINDLEVKWKVNGTVQQLTSGNIKSRYQIYLSEPQTVRFEADETYVNSIYYEKVDEIIE